MEAVGADDEKEEAAVRARLQGQALPDERHPLGPLQHDEQRALTGIGELEGVSIGVVKEGRIVQHTDYLDRAGLTLDEIDLIELNEAFAAQALAVIRDLDLDPAKVNPNGGAIALGHPIAATGSLITAKILGEMERENHELGLVTLCIGGGQGIALLLENANAG